MKPTFLRFPLLTELVLEGKKMLLYELNLSQIEGDVTVHPTFLREDGQKIVMSAKSLFEFMEKNRGKEPQKQPSSTQTKLGDFSSEDIKPNGTSTTNH